MSARVRFAPSPTGYLHIGNIRTALFNFLFVRHTGGQFILRIEDTDRERSKQEYADALMRDLKILGLDWDEGPFYQSERFAIYRDHLKKLQAAGKVYWCYCSEEELAARRKEAMLMKRAPRYDNRCRTISQAEIDKKKAAGVRPTVRFKVESHEPILVRDIIRGDVHFHPDEIGDFVIMRSDPDKPGEFIPTFHMSVCVDDGLMGITHVIRGEDHLSNSPRHALLFEALGFPVPNFAHLSLIHGPGGEPLSKRLASVFVSDFILKEGYLPHALLNYLSLLGWSPKDNREVMSMDTIIQEFDLAHTTRHAAIFNEEKLDWVNSEHLRALPDLEYFDRAAAFIESWGETGKPFLKDRALLDKCFALVKTDLKKWKDMKERLNFVPEPDFRKLPDEEKIVLSQSGAKSVLEKTVAGLASLAGGGEALFDVLVDYLKKNTDQKGKALFMPLRVAVTGHIHGPELKKMFGIFPKEQIAARVQNALRVCP